MVVLGVRSESRSRIQLLEQLGALSLLQLSQSLQRVLVLLPEDSITGDNDRNKELKSESIEKNKQHKEKNRRNIIIIQILGQRRSRERVVLKYTQSHNLKSFVKIGKRPLILY